MVFLISDNGTDQEWAFEASGVTFDSTSPVCSLTRKHPSIPYKGVQSLTWSITDALSLVSNEAVVDGPGTQTNVSYSTAVTTQTLTSQDTGYIGNWIATITD